MALLVNKIDSMTLEQMDRRILELQASLANIDANTPGPISQERIDSMSIGGIDNRIAQLEADLNLPPEQPLLNLNEQQEAYSFSLDDSVSLGTIEDNFSAYKQDDTIIEGPTGKIGFRETIKETDVLEKLPFVGSLYKAGKIVELMKAVQTLSLGETAILRFSEFDPTGLHPNYPPFSGRTVSRPATEKEKNRALKLVEDWVIELEEKQRRGISVGGRIAETVTEMPAFIIEFILTGPLFKSGSTAAKVSATKLLGRYAEKGVGKLAVRAAGASFGSLARTMVNVPRILEGTLSQMTPGVHFTDDGAIAFSDIDVSPTSALLRSIGNLWVENVTEVAGGAIGEGFSFVGKGVANKFPVIGKLTQGIAEKWLSKGTGRTIKQFLTKANTKIGYNGILQELGEEELARIMTAVTPGLADFDNNIDRVKSVFPTWEQLLVETGAITILGGANLAGTKLFRTGPSVKKPVTTTDVLTRARELEILEGEGKEPTFRELAAFINLGAGKAGEALFESEKITKQQQKELKEGGKLFQSEKNAAIADLQNKKALSFINDKTKKIKVFPKVQLPGDIPEESIKVVNLSTKGKALAGKILDSSTEKLTDISGNIALGIARAEDALGFMGDTGLKVQKDFRAIAFRTAVNVGGTSQNIKPWTKGLDKSEKVIVAQLIDGVISPGGQPARLTQRADAIKEQLDAMQKEALATGLRISELTGKAFPQVLNKEGKALLEEGERDGAKSSKVFAWAQNQVKDGKFDNVDDAIIALTEYRRKLLSGKVGYIEGTRTLEIGNEFRDWNLDKILQGTIESSWEKIEAARQWGVVKKRVGPSGETLLPFKQIQIDIEKIRLDVGNNQANSLGNYIRAQYGLSGANTEFVKWSRRARVVQFVGKLAFSPLTISRNILDRYSKGLSHGTLATNVRATIEYPPFLNAWRKSSRLIEDQMVRRGAVLGHGHLSEGVTTAEGILPLAAKPFASSERGNQTYIALVKKIQLEHDVKRLMELEGRDGAVSKMFDRMTAIVGQSQTQTRKRALTSLTNEQLVETMVNQGQIPDNVMAEVLHRTVTDSAFPLTLASKRLWWGSRPEFQVATQFKVWVADQTRFIYKDVMKYGVQTGDWSRLGRFILGTWAAGELYNIARDELLNKDESVLSKAKGGTKIEIITAIRDDLVDGGIVGFISDFTFGIGDWAAGPTINTISNALATPFEAQGAANIADATKKFLLNDIPALRQAQGAIDNLDSIFDKNNLTEDYARWQGRSFDFRRKQGDSITSNIFLRSVRGVGPQRITEKSLSLEMIARQVLVGDYNDAAQHIKKVIRAADVDDLDNAIQSFRQSMRNNSPFGNISQEKLPLFITQFTAKEAVKGIKLQKQWLLGYAQSLKIAITELEGEGFVKDVKIKAEAYRDKMEPIIEKAKERTKEILEEIK